MTTLAKISGRQFFWMLFLFEVVILVLVPMRTTIAFAKQDAWLSVLFGGCTGTIVVLISYQVIKLYPGKTLIEVAPMILGKWVGKCVTMCLLLFAVAGLSFYLRQCTDFIHITLFDRTPIWITALCLIITMVYMMWSAALEGVARVAELFGPFAVAILGAVLILDWKNYDLHWLLPIYKDSGWKHILQGSLPMDIYFGDSFILLMVSPFLWHPLRVRTYALWTVCCGTLSISLCACLWVAMFGPILPSRLLYPGLSATRYVTVMDFIQSIESVGSVIWIIGFFVLMSLILFIICYGIGQWLNLRKWQSTIWWVSAAVLVIALWPENLNTYSLFVPDQIYRRFGIVINLAVPLLLWIVGSIRKRKHGIPPGQARPGR